MSEILAREWVDAVQAWTPPDVRKPGSDQPRPARHPGIQSARELERLQQMAWDEAHAAGHKAGLDKGLAEGRAEVQRQVKALRGVLDRLAAPLDARADALDQELTELALAIAREVIGREVATAPEFILELVPEAVAALPANDQSTRVRLNPKDAALLNEHLPDGHGDSIWKLVEDASISRGGCRIETSKSSVDATLEARLAAVVKRLFADHEARTDASAPADSA